MLRGGALKDKQSFLLHVIKQGKRIRPETSSTINLKLFTAVEHIYAWIGQSRLDKNHESFQIIRNRTRNTKSKGSPSINYIPFFTLMRGINLIKVLLCTLREEIGITIHRQHGDGKQTS